MSCQEAGLAGSPREQGRAERPLGSTLAGWARSIWREYSVALVFLLFAGVASFLSPYFFTRSNLANVLRQVSDIGIVAAGEMLVIVTGGIDLSVGSVVAMASVLSMMVQGSGVAAMFGAGLAAGVAAGWINGLLVTRGRVAPFVATLAMMAMAKGVALIATSGQPVYGPYAETFFYWLGNGHLLGLSTPIVLLLLTYGLGHFVLRYTAFGRNLLAVGGNEEAARLAGVRVDRVKLAAYTLSGLTAAVGSLLITSRMNTGSPIAGSFYELDAIAAVVVGGASLSGGRGSFVGTFFGLLILGTIANVLNLLNVSPYFQYLARGLIIVAAVLLQRRQGTT
ncbi:ribose ABC transporter permease [Limnochorda pilosa]|uniref:Ribose ABC transporter permease n=1 Tax=Limnochorda pilosa TaxID=1555112 RepID=A0A0K2SLA7_LIMPI|nr:ribose ABC transporter permease [Limnochorda pilosa]